jgi:hypothetical protein
VKTGDADSEQVTAVNSGRLDPGVWIWSALNPFDAREIGSVVPDCFSSFARVEHEPGPGRRQSLPLMPESALRAVYELLSPETTTPDRCWFCVWAERSRFRRRALFRPATTSGCGGLSERPHYLYSAKLSELGTLGGFPWSLTPDLWWPADRAWCVASETDFTWTYIGGSDDLIDSICEHPGLKARRVKPDEAIVPHRHRTRAAGAAQRV